MIHANRKKEIWLAEYRRIRLEKWGSLLVKYIGLYNVFNNDDIVRNNMLGLKCNRLVKLQNYTIMPNSKCNAHTHPIFKEMTLIKLYGIFDIQCMEFFYKFESNVLPTYFIFYSDTTMRFTKSIPEVIASCTFSQCVRTVTKLLWGITSLNLIDVIFTIMPMSII